MRKLRNRKSLLVLAITLGVLCALALPPMAFSQGCSLCYTQVANSGARLIRALRSGILILIIPPLSMCIAMMVVTYRKRNQYRQADHSLEAGSDW